MCVGCVQRRVGRKTCNSDDGRRGGLSVRESTIESNSTSRGKIMQAFLFRRKLVVFLCLAKPAPNSVSPSVVRGREVQFFDSCGTVPSSIPPARFEIERGKGGEQCPFLAKQKKNLLTAGMGVTFFLPPQLWETHVWCIGVFSSFSRNNFWGNGEAWPVWYRCSSNTGKNIEFRRWGRQIYARTKMHPPRGNLAEGLHVWMDKQVGFSSSHRTPTPSKPRRYKGVRGNKKTKISIERRKENRTTRSGCQICLVVDTRFIIFRPISGRHIFLHTNEVMKRGGDAPTKCDTIQRRHVTVEGSASQIRLLRH